MSSGRSTAVRLPCAASAGQPQPPDGRLPRSCRYPLWYSRGRRSAVRPGPHRGPCRPHRLDDVVVTGTAAEIAFQALPDLLVARVRIAAQQIDRRENHSRRAVTTLQGVAFMEGLLDRMPLAVVRQPLDRCDHRTVRLGSEDRTTLHARAVEQHGARA